MMSNTSISLVLPAENAPHTIGIIGGMSPESTVTYYQHIVRCHELEFHDHNYPRMVIVSVSFQQYITWQHDSAWEQIRSALEGEFNRAAAAGATFIVLATNTMHKVLPAIDSEVPVLSIVDAVYEHARQHQIHCVGLTGTRFTMSDRFYADALRRRGLRVITPSPSQQNVIHDIIYNELISGEVHAESEQQFLQISHELTRKGADAVLLGCTELEMLTRQHAAGIKFIDSTRVHARAAWQIALGRSIT